MTCFETNEKPNSMDKTKKMVLDADNGSITDRLKKKKKIEFH